MTDGRDTEPFEKTTRPAAYVPRPETEQVLDRLQTWARVGNTASIRLTGAVGMGKSLLLRVLAERLAGLPTAVHVPYPNLMPDDLASWVLEAIGAQRDRDPSVQLVASTQQRAAAGGLLLLIDDAESLPTQTRDALDLWFRHTEGKLRSVRVAVSVPVAAEDANRDDENPTLTQELDVEQSTALLVAAMDRANLRGPLRARFNSAVMLQIHDRARGVPASLLTEAARLYHEWSAGAVPPISARPAEVPARAPTQRALAQLELELAAEPAPATEQRAAPPPIPPAGAEGIAAGPWEALRGQRESAMPSQAAEPIAPRPRESTASRNERGAARPNPTPTAFFDLPPPPPGPTPAARSWTSVRWMAAAGAAALLLAFASTLLPTTRGSDTSVGDLGVSEPPPVAAAPAPAARAPAARAPAARTPEAGAPAAGAPAARAPAAGAESPVPATPLADAGIASIELLDVVPAAPEPTAVVAATPAPTSAPTSAPTATAATATPTASRAPDTPAAIEAPADADNVVIEGVIEPGGWLAASFRAHDIPDKLLNLVAREMGDAYDFRHSQPGDRFRVTRNRAGELVAFDYQAVGSDILELRLENGRYELRRSEAR